MEFELSSSTSKKNKKRKHKSSSSVEKNSKNKKNKKTSSDSADKCEPAKWSAARVLTLLNIVRDYVAKGNVNSDSGFKTKDWSYFLAEFRKLTGLTYKSSVLQSKIAELKSKYIMLESIKKLSGVGWDAITCLPVVSDEFIKDYCQGTRIKCHKMFVKKLDNFEILHDIFAGKVIRMFFNNVFLKTYSICFCFFVSMLPENLHEDLLQKKIMLAVLVEAEMKVTAIVVVRMIAVAMGEATMIAMWMKRKKFHKLLEREAAVVTVVGLNFFYKTVFLFYFNCNNRCQQAKTYEESVESSTIDDSTQRKLCGKGTRTFNSNETTV
jgi:hypothetical protein